ncbi:MAG TPA: AraC family transcriptional regulator ligand-binding domain-containing protein [Rhizomicrobium sp.]|nr:AraC family transcriptional regulator ligand-binding domain-containing protein [Rhizomicrobium sp.]
MAEPTVAAGYPRSFLDFAVAKGADRKTLLARAGLSDAGLADPDNRVPQTGYIALMKEAAQLLNEPAVALRFGEAVRMQDISIVGLICEAAETTAEVGRQLNRYARLVVDDEHSGSADVIRGSVDKHGLWMEFVGQRHPLMVEAELARLLENTRVMFARSAEFQAMRFPIAAHFTHPDPGYASEYARIFRAPVVFGSARNAMLVDPAFLTLRQPPTNRYVFGVLSARADALLKELEAARSMRGKVESVLLPILHTGDAGMDTAAARMGLSRRTLQRKLAAEGTTFEKVLDALRHRLALDYLSGRKASVNEVAYLTGFSEPAAFSRAVKRWTGTTPRALRGR